MDDNSMENCITLQKKLKFQLMNGSVGQSITYFPYPTLPNVKSSFRMSGCFWSFKYHFEQQTGGYSRIESDACHMFLNLVKGHDNSTVSLQYLCDSSSLASVGGLVLSETKWITLKVAFVNPETGRIASEITSEGEPHCGKILCPCRQTKLCLRKDSFCHVDYLQSFYVINKCSKPINGMAATYYCSFDAVVTLTLYPHRPTKSVTVPQIHNFPTNIGSTIPVATYGPSAASVNDLHFKSQQDISKRIFHAKSETDFKLIAEGKEFPCHKTILAGHSQMFYKMFYDFTKRPGFGPNRLYLQNISVLGVESFLKYLYYADTSFSDLPVYVSLDLLRISEKYAIPHLREASCEVILSKTADDMDLKTALQMYHFASSPSFPPLLSSTQYNKMKKAALQYFIKKYVDLVKSEEFAKLFEENREKAQELLIKIHKNKDKL